jgi:DNA-binding CsgD family transcriptional regulator
LLELLIDRIYEAAGSPRLWAGVTQLFGDHLEADRCCLGVVPQVGSARWIETRAGNGQSEPDPVAEIYRVGCPDGRWSRLSQVSFVQNTEALSAGWGGRIRREVRALWQVGTAIPLPTGDLAIIVAERRAENGPFGARSLSSLDAVRPHLVRACHLSARFGCERARITTTAFDRLGLPAAVLSASGQILAINNHLQARHEKIASGQHCDAIFKCYTNSKILQEAIGGVTKGHRESLTLPVRALSDHRAFVAHILRLDTRQAGIFDPSALQVVLNQVGAPSAPDNNLLHLLFDLTPAEARLLRALATGMRLQLYAESIGVQASTVRSQLKSIFNKTGTTRQAELVGIVASISTFNRYAAC